MNEEIVKHWKIFNESLTDAKPTKNARREKFNGLIRGISGVKSPYYNYIDFYKRDENLISNIQEQIAFFSQLNLPFVCWTDHADNELKESLKICGFYDGGIYKGITADITDIQSPDGKFNFKFTMAKTSHQLSIFTDILKYLYNDDPTTIAANLAINNYLCNNKKIAKYYLFYENDRPIATTTAFYSQDSVSIWNVGTVKEYRKMGLASYLVQLALHEAAKQGKQIGVSFLTSEAMASNIFKGFGFKDSWLFHPFTYN